MARRFLWHNNNNKKKGDLMLEEATLLWAQINTVTLTLFCEKDV